MLSNCIENVSLLEEQQEQQKHLFVKMKDIEYGYSLHFQTEDRFYFIQPAAP